MQSYNLYLIDFTGTNIKTLWIGGGGGNILPKRLYQNIKNRYDNMPEKGIISCFNAKACSQSRLYTVDFFILILWYFGLLRRNFN